MRPPTITCPGVLPCVAVIQPGTYYQPPDPAPREWTSRDVLVMARDWRDCDVVHLVNARLPVQARDATQREAWRRIEATVADILRDRGVAAFQLSSTLLAALPALHSVPMRDGDILATVPQPAQRIDTPVAPVAPAEANVRIRRAQYGAETPAETAALFSAEELGRMTGETFDAPSLYVLVGAIPLQDETRVVAIAAVYSPESRRVYLYDGTVSSREDVLDLVPVRREVEQRAIAVLQRLGVREVRVRVDQASSLPRLLTMTSFVDGRVPR